MQVLDTFLKLSSLAVLWLLPRVLWRMIIEKWHHSAQQPLVLSPSSDLVTKYDFSSWCYAGAAQLWARKAELLLARLITSQWWWTTRREPGLTLQSLQTVENYLYIHEQHALAVSWEILSIEFHCTLTKWSCIHKSRRIVVLLLP